MNELLTPSQMACADRFTMEAGTPGIVLMENAGKAVAAHALSRWPDARRIAVICGNGNNGGDGFVAARHLHEAGKTARVFLALGHPRSADALAAFQAMPGQLVGDQFDPSRFDLVIDGLFGAGIDRPVTGRPAELIASINNAGVPVLAIDLPSGVEGSGGKVMGVAIRAAATITFFRRKPGHLLLPGRAHCGEVGIAQIGIGASALANCGFEAWSNSPGLWQQSLPQPGPESHKYRRGHTLAISGGPWATGAARLAAAAALRAGSGLVTLASPQEALAINAAHLTAVMLVPLPTPGGLGDLIDARRITAFAAGPGLEPDGATRELVLAGLASGRACMLDAGALSAFEDDGQTLFQAIAAAKGPVVLSPHEGEFRRLFGEADKAAGRLETARKAARRSSATVILKGADTVIAAPDGRAAINDNAPPWLATAGSGDVLTGIVAGLLAQSMPGFEAGCAAVWLHGEAGRLCGAGLTAEDLDSGLHQAIRALCETPGSRQP